MYAVSNVNRVYISILLLLCAAFLLAPSLANANDGYWSTQERRFISQNEVSSRVNNVLNGNVRRPSGSTLSTVPSAPAISKNAAGGLSATTNNILKTLDQPSSFSSTLNNSAVSAKTALKSCVRSPACAGRAFGTGAIIYEGIKGWKEVYDMIYDPNTNVFTQPEHDNPEIQPPTSFPFPSFTEPAQRAQWLTANKSECPETLSQGRIVVACSIGKEKDGYGNPLTVAIGCRPYYQIYPFVGLSDDNLCQYADDDPYEWEIPYRPVALSELDQRIDDSYEPAVSDAPIVLLSGEPETITLTEPEPANLPSTTTTNTDSNNQTTTTVKNSVITYNILNNNSSTPSIESTVTETSTTYDENSNFLGSMTSTTTNNAVAPDPMPPSSSGASADIEIPPFCTWAKIVCDWIGWTQEELEGEEPDLSQLITVFEPDEEGYDVGIGSGSCPAPMLLNLGIIGKTVEVKYDPFCSFLEMIKPFVLAAAYLFAAYLYIGVLKRG